MSPNPRSRIVLVTGPARSGKSEWAERLAHTSGQAVTYVATAAVDASDAEWVARIQNHQQRRPATWQTMELSFELPEAIATCPADTCLLIDSLGTWIVHYLEQDGDHWQDVVTTILDALQATAGTIIFVSEETGWGVIPAYPSGRLFRDRLGSLTRHIAALADAVYLVTAGYALDLRRLGHCIAAEGADPWDERPYPHTK